MTEIKVNTGFGRYPVRDPITPPPTEEVEEELKKFPMPFGRLTIGFVMGVFVALTFAQYWQNKHYGEMIATFESIKKDNQTLVNNTEIVKGLVQKNEQIANRVDESVGKLTAKIEELKLKRSKIVPK